MRCRSYWPSSFLGTFAPKTWLGGEYRRHRQRVLLERERALLPSSQNAVDAERRVRELLEQRRGVIARIQGVQRELRDLRSELYRVDAARRHGAQPRERRSFVAACPDADCRGFLSERYCCGTCGRQFCAACREIRDEGHACNPETVATIRAIRDDSRACPGCGMAISRVSGCDQMFCPAPCETLFSYATGARLVNVVVHNPHALERLRELRQDGARLAAEDMCGGWPQLALLPAEARSDGDLIALVQAARHVEQVELPRLARQRDNEDLRVRFCLRDIDEAALGRQLEARERQRELQIEIRRSLELAVALVLELSLRLVHGEASLAEAMGNCVPLLESAVNAPLRRVADRFNCAVPQIEPRRPAWRAAGYVPKPKKRSAEA